MTLNYMHFHCVLFFALSFNFQRMILLSLIICATCPPGLTQFNSSLLCHLFRRPIGGIWSNRHHSQLTYCPPGGGGNPTVFVQFITFSLFARVIGFREGCGSYLGRWLGNHLMREALQRELQFIHTDGSTFVGQVCWMLHATVLIT